VHYAATRTVVTVPFGAEKKTQTPKPKTKEKRKISNPKTQNQRQTLALKFFRFPHIFLFKK